MAHGTALIPNETQCSCRTQVARLVARSCLARAVSHRARMSVGLKLPWTDQVVAYVRAL